MYCVGLTGSIASGKSTVATLFAQLGVDVIDTDQIAKQLTAKDQPALTKIIEHVGSTFLDKEGHLHRRRLREHIFNHPAERLWLEELLHPLIRQALIERLQQPAKLYYMIEIPLLFNRQTYLYLDRVLVVMSEPAIQTQRIIQRDHHTEEQAKTILQTQASTEDYRALADDVIVNHTSLKDLELSVLHLHHAYLQASKLKN